MADRPNDPATVPGEQVSNTAPLGQETKPKAFDAQGSIGKHFTDQGAIGGTAQKVGGPLDKEGMIGKQFTTEGAVGGKVQDAMGGEKKTGSS